MVNENGCYPIGHQRALQARSSRAELQFFDFFQTEIRAVLQKQGASLVAQMEKNPPECGRVGFDPWVGKIPWRRAWQPAPVFLPGESPWAEEPGGLQSMGLQRVGHG